MMFARRRIICTPVARLVRLRTVMPQKGFAASAGKSIPFRPIQPCLRQVPRTRRSGSRHPQFNWRVWVKNRSRGCRRAPAFILWPDSENLPPSPLCSSTMAKPHVMRILFIAAKSDACARQRGAGRQRKLIPRRQIPWPRSFIFFFVRIVLSYYVRF